MQYIVTSGTQYIVQMKTTFGDWVTISWYRSFDNAKQYVRDGAKKMHPNGVAFRIVKVTATEEVVK